MNDKKSVWFWNVQKMRTADVSERIETIIKLHKWTGCDINHFMSIVDAWTILCIAKLTHTHIHTARGLGECVKVFLSVCALYDVIKVFGVNVCGKMENCMVRTKFASNVNSFLEWRLSAIDSKRFRLNQQEKEQKKKHEINWID